MKHTLLELVEERIDAVQKLQTTPESLTDDIPASQMAKMIDHTLLKAEATKSQVIALCQQAIEYHFAAVCIHPSYVPLCHDMLRATDVEVCSVIGFPLGATLTEVKTYEAEKTIAAGATEIDMVLHVGALQDRDYEWVHDDIAAVAQVCHANDAMLKVIIENALLTDEGRIAACYLAQRAGADFVKTSTGFASSGAKAKDVALMRQTVGPGMGIKAAGGIRSYADAIDMIRAGATRIGASAGIKIIKQALERESR
jgi:deoxyribose-phosphate aldolase